MKKLIIAILLLASFQIVAQSQKIIWAKSFGGILDDEANLIETDSNGNIFIVGRFQGNADFDPNPNTEFRLSTADPLGDLFIAKYTTNGAFLWVKSMTYTGDMKGTSLKIDNNGNIIIAGTFQGVGLADFDPSPTATFNIGSTDLAFPDYFFIKLDNNGVFIWAHTIPSYATSLHFSIDLDIDNSNNIFITGTFFGANDFDFRLFNSLVLDSGPNESIFVAKYGPNANLLFAKTIKQQLPNVVPANPSTPINYAAAYHISIDKTNNNVYIVGAFQGTIEFPRASCPPCNIVLSSVGNPSFQTQNRFITKLSTAGDILFAKNMDYTSTSLRDVKIDSNGDILIFGNFFGTTNFNPPSGHFDGYYRDPRGWSDLYVLKFNSSGLYQWVRTYGTTNCSAIARKIVLDDNNNIFLFGEFNRQLDFTSNGIPTANSLTTNSNIEDVVNLFLVKFDPNATSYNWGKTMSGHGSYGIQGYGLTNDNLGNLLLVGQYSSSAEMNFNSIPSYYLIGNSPQIDAFFMKFAIANSTVKSGSWWDPTTWLFNRIPENNETIMINTGHTVNINSPVNVKKIINKGVIELMPTGNLILNN